MSVRLEWDGKPAHVERIALPFQTVETINESRATRERDAGSLFRGEPGRRDAWRNLLIWGDNKLVMSSLLQDFAGRVDVVYIDPPFDTGADFTINIRVGDETVEKTPSILEEHAYRDTWGRGRTSYLGMMYERLVLIHELLDDRGSLFLHCDWRVGHYLKIVCDEIFGSDRLVNEIAWCYTGPGSPGMRQFNRKHDTILWYSKGSEWNFYADAVRVEHDPKTLENFKRGLSGSGFVADTYELAERGKVPEDWWLMAIAARYPIDGVFRTGYATEKPWQLIERILMATSTEDSLVADMFAGSGTTAAVAETLGRRWIACDLGRFAIHSTRKRLLNLPDCRPFEIRNLGSYERQRWRQDSGNGALRGYIDTLLAFYRAEPVENFTHLHGRKSNRMVHVGATDAPITIDEAEEVMDEMADNGIAACDLLGWEWEMGFHDTIGERARRRGLDVRALQIPREVMERRVQEADAVRFFELGYVDLDVRRQGHEAKVVLKDFAIPSEDLIPPQVRERISRWSDLIDYWSVDFDHRNGVFHNQWQAYRTRAEPTLATESDWHEYPAAAQYAIVIKIIDIFGNDTTKLAEVTIK
jgi:adenine-specific DNA-methyltransferase